MADKEEATEPRVVEAVAIAAGGRHVSGAAGQAQAIEAAMAQAVHDASKETEVVWAREDLSLEEKQAQIAAITAPEEIRRRMLEAREKAKVEFAQALADAAESDKEG